MRRALLTTIVLVSSAVGAHAAAQDGTSTGTAAVAQPEPTKPAEPAAKPAAPKPPPYTLPFQLRGAAIGRSVRLDSAFAFYETAVGSSPTIGSFAAISYPITPEFAVFARMGLSMGSLVMGERGSAFSNPAIGANYMLKLPSDLRLVGMLAFAIPVGGGGGDMPDAPAKAARTAGVQARSGMDNTILSSNDFGVMTGLDLAWVAEGATVQGEVTFNFTFRARGEMDQVDETKVNLTAGFFTGYFLTSWLSLGAELRLQRWIQPPKAVDNAMNRQELISQVTLAGGPRFHIQLGETMWLRPAIVYARAVDKPMSTLEYNIIHVDLPFSF